MAAALERLVIVGVTPEVIVNIGAAKGRWTEMDMKYWPTAEYILVEPIKEQIVQIDPELQSNPKVKVIEAIAGRGKGVVELTVTHDLDGSGVYGGIGDNTRPVPVITLNDLIEDRNRAVLFKLDTHGFEIPIFEGAVETLEKTEVIIVEIYGFYVSPHGQLFHELSAFLLEKGFRLFDVVEIMRRPKDNAFWQADAVYLRNEHPVFLDNSYK